MRKDQVQSYALIDLIILFLTIENHNQSLI
jgi:hypothetical protein